MHGELLDANRVQPRRNRTFCFQCVQTPAVAEIDRLLQQAVRDDLILRRRRDDELARRLVVRVIDHRQPLPRAFGQFSLNALHSPYLLGMMRSPGPPSRPFAPSGVPAGEAGMP